MALFDWSSFRVKAKVNYEDEYKNSESIQDEVKIFNERFPKWLEPLYKIDEQLSAASGGSEGSVGEFSDGMMVGDTNMELIWSFFLGKNFHKKCIAGIVGNIGQETGGTYDPKTIQGGGKGPGTGLIQWGDNMDGGRWNLLEDWASKNGKDKWSTQTQMEWLWIEMQDSWHLDLMAGYLKQFGYSPGGDTLKSFSKVDNIEHAMKIFELTIERASHKAYANRLRYGEEAYAKLKDWNPNMGTSSSSSASGALVVPYKRDYTVTSEYGPRNISYGSNDHKGIDLSTGTNTPIYPIRSGKVVLNEFANGPGWNIVIDHGVLKNKQIFARYMHLQSQSSLKVGQSVTIDTQIGREGATGGNYGVHLHLEIQEQAVGSAYTYGNGHVNPRNHFNFTGKGR